MEMATKVYVPYEERDIQIQIRIDALMRMHGNKYPLSWYEGMSDRQITGMYHKEAVRVAKVLCG